MSLSDCRNNAKTSMMAALLLLAVVLFIPVSALACSCVWKGPFLVAAKDAPLIVIGKIIRHHPGKSPVMDILVLDILKGALLDSGLTVAMGDGMHCRPSMDAFPVGTQWILAINGQGAKPGNGWAISHCGEYWLRLDKDEVIGSIDGEMNQVKKMPLKQLKQKFLYPRFSETFSDRVRNGKPFRRPFGSRFTFVLEPMPNGWQISIRESGRSDDLSRLTPPFHFAPNPREIEGWHLLKNPSVCTTRPYQADAGPSNPRKFIFSPEVGKSIPFLSGIQSDDVEKVEQFGRGTLKIEKFDLSDRENGCPKIEEMTFSVHLEGGY